MDRKEFAELVDNYVRSINAGLKKFREDNKMSPERLLDWIAKDAGNIERRGKEMIENDLRGRIARAGQYDARRCLSTLQRYEMGMIAKEEVVANLREDITHLSRVLEELGG